ncbi:AAA family ATPase [Streptomyces sp. NPDC002431]
MTTDRSLTTDKPVAAGRAAAGDTPSPSFSVLLQTERKNKGLTQQELADLAGLSVRAVRDLELGRTLHPRQETVRLLVDALRPSERRRMALEAAAGTARGAVRNLGGLLVPPPAPLRPVVGREPDVAALTGLVESSGARHVTIVGAPGVGKSSLAQEAAAAVHRRGRMPAAWLPERTGPAVSGTDAGLPAGLADGIGDRPLLLVVDDLTARPEAAEEVRRLLRHCPELRVLSTSRTPPPDADAATYPLLPLPAHGAAVDVMLAHCARLRPDLAPTPGTTEVLARVCAALDGIPLALSSAATWLSLCEPEQLLDLAARDPLGLAAPVSGEVPDLVGQLTGAIDALDADDAALLGDLVTLRSPWTWEEAAGLTGRTPTECARGVHALRMRGLVTPAAPSSGGHARFAVLNLVRSLVTGRRVPVPH